MDNFEDLQPRIVLEHRGRGTYKVKLKTKCYWKYISNNWYTIYDINKAYNLKNKIAFSDLLWITNKYIKSHDKYGEIMFTKENVIKFKEELEALILINKMAKH